MRCKYPLLLDVSQRLIVIVGGGAVALRKAHGLIDAGAERIRCVALNFVEGFPQEVERVAAAYEPRHLEGAGLVFGATDDAEVNATVVRDAHRLGLLVNRVDSDEQEPGDFSTPAIVREGELVIGVSAGSAALSAVIRDAVRQRLDARWIMMADAMRSLRPRITADRDLPIARRRDMLKELASEEALNVLEQRGIDGLWSWVKGRSTW